MCIVRNIEQRNELERYMNTNGIVSYIKNTGLDTLAIYNGADELIATSCKIKEGEEMYGHKEYRICMVGGIAHGKTAYAADFEDLNEKSAEIATLPR